MQKFANKNFCDEKNLVATIQLSRTRNIGPITFLGLIRKYNNPQNALEKVSEILKSKGLQKDVISKSQAEDEISNLKKFGANIVTIFDENYPKLLSEIYDPPIIISCKGDFSIAKNKAVGVVGARSASANGLGFTYKISSELSKAGYTIISGLAKGVDASAHKSVIDNKGKTIAVIAGGIDNIYPKENKKLYDDLAENGLIISENPFGSLPKSESFPRRNRIISGLSLGIIVVEAALKSGSLITARFASEQGREVFCVPGFPLDARAEGPNDLIKKGANLITSAQDVILNLAEFSEEKIIERNQSNLLFEGGNDFEVSEDLIFAQNKEENLQGEQPQESFLENFNSQNAFDNNSSENLSSGNLSDKVLQFLSFSPIEIDELLRRVEVSTSELSSTLLELEITGNITRHPGNKISKIA